MRSFFRAAAAVVLAAVLAALPTLGLAAFAPAPDAVLTGENAVKAAEALPFEAQEAPAVTEADRTGSPAALPDASALLPADAPKAAPADGGSPEAAAEEPVSGRDETPPEEPGPASPAEPDAPSLPGDLPAEEIAFNTRVTGTLRSILETKRYILTVTERGAVQFAFYHPNGDLSDCRWYTKLYEIYSPDGSGRTAAYRELQSVSYNRLGEASLSPITGVHPGKYLLTVDCAAGFTDKSFVLAAAFKADPRFEYECNDTPSRYTGLPCDVTYTGTASRFTDDRRDEDWYLFRVTEKGYCVVDLTHDAAQTANWSINAILWKIEVTTLDGAELWASAQTASESLTSSGVLGLAAGEYFIHITSVNQVDVPYGIRSTFTYEPITELERNDTQTTSTHIGPAQTVTAALSQREGVPDEDWYAFTMEEDGVMMLSFSHESVDSDRDAWRVAIRTGDGAVLYSIQSKRNDSETRSPYLGLPAGTYYIRVDSDGLYRSGQVYGLQYRSAYSPDWETEPNDEPSSADALVLGRETLGALVEVGVRFDVDWYAFDFDGGDLSVIFRHEGDRIDRVAWTVTVLDEAGRELTSLPVNRTESVRELPLYGLAKGRYYVRVDTGDYFSADRYGVTVTVS